ncbi:hypothetical protein GOV11_01860 [Candidatus Woesearchaeota archaeon]|nr:hypothetical protein [Candidatus Woesearchaeota archaeon]
MNTRKLQRFANRYGIFIILALCLIAFLIPLLVRFAQGAPITPRAESYTFLRQADLLLEGDIYDALKGVRSFQTPHTVLLAGMEFLGAAWLLPVLIGMLFIILLDRYLKTLLRHSFVRMIAVIATILSPVTILFATSHNPWLLCLTFISGALLAFKKHRILGALLLWLAIITAPVLGMLCAGCIFVYSLARRSYRQLVAVVVVGIIAMVWYWAWIGSFTWAPLLAKLTLNPHIFFELGEDMGVSIFFIILAGYGLFSSQLRKKQLAVAYLFVAVLIAMIFKIFTPILTVALSVLIGYAVADLAIRKWDLDILRQASLSLIFCIGLFLCIILIRDRIDDIPDAEFVESMRFMQLQRHDGAILSDPTYAPMIEYFSGRRATLSENSEQEDLEQALYSRTAEPVYDYLELTGTAYIFMTDEMVNARYSRSDEGLLFVLPNTQRFVLIREKDKSDLWYYIPRQQG